MKLSTPLLLLAGASTCVSAQWSDYLNKILKTGEKQVPLKKTEPEGHVEDREILIARRVRNVTSENWLSLVQPSSAVTEEEQKEGTAEAEAAIAMPTEWYYYFTSSAVNGTKNATYWDGIFNVSIRILNPPSYTPPRHPHDANRGVFVSRTLSTHSQRIRM